MKRITRRDFTNIAAYGGLGLAVAGRSAEAPSASSGRTIVEPTEWGVRNDEYMSQLEKYLQDWLVNRYEQRAAMAWNRDYSSVDAFDRSVEPNRARWREVLGPPVLTKTGALERRPHAALVDIKGEWLKLPMGPLAAEGILVIPVNASPQAPVPLVIVQHGISGVPESLFDSENKAYHGYGRHLAGAGFAVLAPINLRAVMPRSPDAPRNRIERLCRLAATSLPGIELVRMQNLLDVVLADPRIDRQLVGMWGLSLGGLATMFWMPLERRIRVGVVSGWFNHRLTKMVVPSDRYSCFLEAREDHAFFHGWLTEFSDHDAVSLICPRPLLIQHGKRDRIAHWPDLVKEFESARTHYDKLRIGDRIELDMYDGGHEVRVPTGVAFLKRHLGGREAGGGR